MKLGLLLMRRIFPRIEARRREFRRIVQEIEAHSEDLSRMAMNGRRNETIERLTHPQNK